ncbi:hypothetical protein [Amycolatopsis sp. cmx-4-61]|uniref:hypothetical protein n=1 Tax=Amycolatopsis sp. cmx-4-61 TaxID=2790937 RepID=UPI00397E17F4
MTGSGFVEVQGAGRGRNIGRRLLSVSLVVAGPVVAAAAGGMDQPVLGGVLAAVLMPMGVSLWRGTTRAKRRLLRLDEVGLLAKAEILAAAAGGGDDNPLRLTLRVSGPEVPAFEAVVTTGYRPDLVPGRELTAVVDPADRTFLVRELDDANWP